MVLHLLNKNYKFVKVKLDHTQGCILKANEHNLRVRRVAIAILSYLREHSMAKDSAAGIAKFWVGENGEIVTAALALLLNEKVLEKRGEVYQLANSAGTGANPELIEKVLKRLN